MGMQANLAAMLAYLFGVISGLVIFLIEKKNKYVRFHAMQSILLSVALVAIWIVYFIIALIPVVGVLIAILGPLTGLASLILWIVLLIKAYQGEEFKLPIIGDIAEKNA